MADHKRKSGFEDDDDAAFGRQCRDPEHSPPTMLYIPPGKRYRHVCPSCGAEVVMHGARFTLNSADFNEHQSS